ncbi:MAG: hypothetical protein IT169_01015 [Bryobacterales bacterium]|nr:hypothetical protein [Bryobacterales bacterium]
MGEIIGKPAGAARSIADEENGRGGCAPLERRLGDTLDVTITAEDLEQLKAEMQGCPPCLEFIESLKTTVRLCHDFGVEEAPAPLTEETRSRMVAAYEKVLARRHKTP